jgi:hypothetical protein
MYLYYPIRVYMATFTADVAAPWDGSRKLYFSPLVIRPEVLRTICGATVQSSLTSAARCDAPSGSAKTFPFDARAEVTLANSGAVEARVRELILHGCFSKVSDFTSLGYAGARKNSYRVRTFEAQGTVIYSQPDVGFGLAFREIKPPFLAALQKWLVLAKKKYESQAR